VKPGSYPSPYAKKKSMVGGVNKLAALELRNNTTEEKSRYARKKESAGARLDYRSFWGHFDARGA